MTIAIPRRHSPRNQIEYRAFPTIRGSMWGGGGVYPNRCDIEAPASHYGFVLDCVLEMARDVADGNGVTPDQAVEQVLRAETWKILPTHRAEIVKRLSA